MITFSESAQHYLLKLLTEEEAGTAIRVFVTEPNTARAEVGFSFCGPEDRDTSDLSFQSGGFEVLVDADSVSFLEDSMVEVTEDAAGSQLTIKAPNLKRTPPGPQGPLADQINHVLDTEVNPALGGHGGWVRLVEIADADIAVLEFGGGCVGCSMSFMTMKQGVEHTLKERIPSLRDVRDATDHSDKRNAYYK